MIVIKNNIVPFRGYVAIAIAPFILVRKDAFAGLSEEMRETVIRHERIHCWQQIMLLVVLFYVLYAVFYLFNLVKYRSHKEAYMNIPFEREAYRNQDDELYAKNVPFMGWVWYIWRNE